MDINQAKAVDIDQYISGFPEPVCQMLQQLRDAIRLEAPTATEVISYGMPAFKLNGILVYFAGYQNHIGFYPTGSGIAAFKDRITNYKTSKGTIQFTLDKPLPLELIREIVRFRVAENLLKRKRK